MNHQDERSEEIPEPPSIPIRAGGVIRVRDVLDLIEATDADESDVFCIADQQLILYREQT